MASTKKTSRKRNSKPSTKRVTITVPAFIRTVYYHVEPNSEKYGGFLMSARVR